MFIGRGRKKRIFIRVYFSILVSIFIFSSFNLETATGSGNKLKIRFVLIEENGLHRPYINAIFPSEYFEEGPVPGIEFPYFNVPSFDFDNIKDITVILSTGETIHSQNIFYPIEKKIILNFKKSVLLEEDESIIVNFNFDPMTLPEGWGKDYKAYNVSFDTSGTFDLYFEIPKNYLILRYTPDFGILIDNVVKWEICTKEFITISIVYLPFGTEEDAKRFRSGKVEQMKCEVFTYPDIMNSKKEASIRTEITMPKIKEDSNLEFQFGTYFAGDTVIYKLNNFNSDFSEGEPYDEVFDKEKLSQKTYYVDREDSNLIIYLIHSKEIEDQYHYILGIKTNIEMRIEKKPSNFRTFFKFYEIDSYFYLFLEKSQNVKTVNRLYEFVPKNQKFIVYFPKNVNIVDCNPKESEKQNKEIPKYVMWNYFEEDKEFDRNFKITIEFIDQKEVLNKLFAFLVLEVIFVIFNIWLLKFKNLKDISRIIFSGTIVLFTCGILVVYLIYEILPIRFSEIFTRGIPTFIVLLSIFIFLALFSYGYTFIKIIKRILSSKKNEDSNKKINNIEKSKTLDKKIKDTKRSK